MLVQWSTASSAATIKIGVISPLSGRFAKQGLETHQGVEVAVTEANEAGGIGGRKLQLISRDDQSKPDVAISDSNWALEGLPKTEGPEMPSKGLSTAVIVKRDGEWKIAAHRTQVPSAPAGGPTE